jgi:DNA helicase HerA-like ATPase
MFIDDNIWIAKSEKDVFLRLRMANRHGLITGASGTGKTTTVRALAESFSDAGVPVFFCDVKGDLGGLCLPGDPNGRIAKCAKDLGVAGYSVSGYPVEFWDVYGDNGHPIRTTVSDMGPMLLARLMNLTDIQSDVLNIVFRIADERGLLLLDMKDLVAMIQYVSEHQGDFTSEYGHLSSQSLGAIQRAVRSLEDQGGDVFFGEPSIDIYDWLKTKNGKGTINVLNSSKLVQNPKLYATFMLWMMSELFEKFPEAGDADKPKLVFFFDEAHMLFTDAPKSLVQKVEQVVKLIRSKSVGIYFISQSPSDIPDAVLAQLSNRVQHALRAYTPAEQKAVRAAASAFRPNPKFKTEEVITELGVGEALVSCLDAGGRPEIVEKAMIVPPRSSLDAISAEQYRKLTENDMDKKYRKVLDRESAYEKISKEKKAVKPEESKKAPAKAAPKKSAASSSAKKTASKATSRAVNSAAGTIGTQVGKSLVRGLLGGLK